MRKINQIIGVGSKFKVGGPSFKVIIIGVLSIEKRKSTKIMSYVLL